MQKHGFCWWTPHSETNPKLRGIICLTGNPLRPRSERFEALDGCGRVVQFGIWLDCFEWFILSRKPTVVFHSKYRLLQTFPSSNSGMILLSFSLGCMMLFASLTWQLRGSLNPKTSREGVDEPRRHGKCDSNHAVNGWWRLRNQFSFKSARQVNRLGPSGRVRLPNFSSQWQPADRLTAKMHQESDTPYAELSDRFQQELLPELSKADSQMMCWRIRYAVYLWKPCQSASQSTGVPVYLDLSTPHTKWVTICSRHWQLSSSILGFLNY